MEKLFIDFQTIEPKDFFGVPDVPDYISEDAKKMQELVDLFRDWFGNDNVEFQYNKFAPPTTEIRQIIMIRVPETTVTNERDRSIKIQDLFIAIAIRNNLSLICDILMNRATYTEKQWLSCYRHSHLPRTFHSLDCRYFSNPCLGDGPLRGTVENLMLSRNLQGYVDINLWRLFCIELQKYITVESLTGGPYIGLETVGTTLVQHVDFKNYLYGVCANYETIMPIVQSNTLQYFISALNDFLSSGELTFGYVKNRFILGISTTEFVIKLSNHIIKFLNTIAFEHNEDVANIKKWFIKAIVREGKIYKITEETNYDSINFLNGVAHICNFHNEEVKLKILPEENNEEDNVLNLLEPKIALHIKNLILTAINYGKSTKSTAFMAARKNIENLQDDNSKRVLFIRL